ncbi:kinase-like domain-containing protein [Blastocladiella britannica]|nr:kinase-like domain-containing protein [Blastocladiella britannica]
MANRPNPLDQLPAPSQKKLLDVYERGSKLGSGTFAEVYEVTNKATGEKYALKTMRKRKLKGREKVIVREIEVLAKLAAHPNIVGLVAEDGFFETDDAYHLVMELCTGKELFDSIVERGFYSERDAVNVIAQVLDAIKFCHDQGVVHRDLKPENLLLKDNSANARVMVADFGLSRLAEFDNQMFMTACGTPAYCAPEIILNKGHAMPVDMWSLGCIAYVILCGYIPFWAETQRGVFDEIVKCRYTFDPEYWSAISADAKDFIAKLLVVDPALRMSADQALEHPWIQRASKSQRPGLVRPPKSLADTTSSISASSASIDAVNLVPTLKRVQKSHPAREKFKGAVNAIMLASQMQARRTSAGSVEGADDVSAPIAVDDSVTDISRPFVATASAPSLPVLPERK